MHRFYHAQLTTLADSRPDSASVRELSGTAVELTKEESHHASKVLRLSPGDAVVLFDGAGTTALATIAKIGSRVVVRIDELRHEPPPRPRLTMACPIPKGPRADAMVDQLSQLGCDELIPLRTARSIVDPRDAKLERFQRACIESAKQCQRAHVMHIAPLASLHELMKSSEHDLKLIALPDGQSLPSRETLNEAQNVLVLIGPEGGWLDEEVHDATKSGFLPWKLGPLVMRIETAAITATSIVRYMTMNPANTT